MPAEDPILGQIMPFAGTTVPKGWAICDGTLLAIQTHQALFSLLGTYYGGNGVTTFGLPDLRGRAILGSSGTAGQHPAGALSGTTSVALTTSQLPQHNHVLQATTTAGAGRGAQPTNNLFAGNTLPTNDPKKIFTTVGSNEMPLAAGTNLANEGSGQAHNNMQPYLVINYLIAVSGIYPSRD